MIMSRFPILLIALGSLGLAQAPSFHPKEGTTWTRTHRLEMRLGFDQISLAVNGQLSDNTDFDIEVVSNNNLIVEDSVIEWKPTGPRHLERLYVDVKRDREAQVKMSAMGKTADTKTKVHAESPLQGQRLDLRSKAPGKTWLPTFVESSDKGLPKEWLRGLEIDLDYSLLLPPANTKAGGRWQVDAEAFLLALHAGQGLPFDFGSAQGEDLPLWIGGVADQPELPTLWKSFKASKVECKLMPQRKAGHLRLLEVHVSASFDGEADLEDWAMSSMDSRGNASTEMQVESASQTTLFSGAGVYLWDLDRRVMHSFNFRGEGRFVRDQDLSVQAGDEEMAISLTTEGQFQLTVNAKTER